MRWNRTFTLILAYAVLTAGAAVMLLPLAWMVSASFKTLFEVMRVPPTWIPEQPTTANYREVFERFPFWRYFWNSVAMSGLVVAGVLVTSTLAGYALARYRFRFREPLFILFLTSLMIPFQVRMIPLYTMAVKADLLDTFTGLVVPFVFDALGIFLMRQFFLTIPQELIDSARIDGASELRILTTVVIPQASPGLAALAIITFSHTWEEYLWPLIISTSDRTRTLPLGLQFFSEQYSTNIHYQMAAATLAVIPQLVLFFLLQRKFVEGMTLTGMKG